MTKGVLRRIGLGGAYLGAAALVALAMSAVRGPAPQPVSGPDLQSAPHELCGAGSTISGLPAIGTLQPDDLLLDVDVHDTSLASTGTDKRLTVAPLFGSPTPGHLIGRSSTATPITPGSGLSLSNSTLTATGGSGSGTVNSWTASQLSYYAAHGTAVSGLGLGPGLSISGGNLNVTSGSGMVNLGTASQLAYYAASGSAFTGMGLRTGLSISGDSLNVTGGTVATASLTTANGFVGSIAKPTTTSAITISTTAIRLLKGNGMAISAATAGTDYQALIALTTTGTSGSATFTGGTLNIPQYAVDSVTVSSGTAGQVAYYGASGMTVQGTTSGLEIDQH